MTRREIIHAIRERIATLTTEQTADKHRLRQPHGGPAFAAERAGEVMARADARAVRITAAINALHQVRGSPHRHGIAAGWEHLAAREREALLPRATS